MYMYSSYAINIWSCTLGICCVLCVVPVLFLQAEWHEREKKAKEMEKKKRDSVHRISGDHSSDIEKILETIPVEKKTTIARRASQRKQSISVSRKASM